MKKQKERFKMYLYNPVELIVRLRHCLNIGFVPNDPSRTNLIQLLLKTVQMIESGEFAVIDQALLEAPINDPDYWGERETPELLDRFGIKTFDDILKLNPLELWDLLHQMGCDSDGLNDILENAGAENYQKMDILCKHLDDPEIELSPETCTKCVEAKIQVIAFLWYYDPNQRKALLENDFDKLEALVNTIGLSLHEGQISVSPDSIVFLRPGEQHLILPEE